jgi:hypothetical protein
VAGSGISLTGGNPLDVLPLRFTLDGLKQKLFIYLRAAGFPLPIWRRPLSDSSERTILCDGGGLPASSAGALWALFWPFGHGSVSSDATLIPLRERSSSLLSSSVSPSWVEEAWVPWIL